MILISTQTYVYLYCVTLIAEYYAQGCLRWRKARTYLGIPGICLWNHHDQKGTAKPRTFRQIFCPYKYFVPGWTWTRTEEVCRSIVKYYRLGCSGILLSVLSPDTLLICSTVILINAPSLINVSPTNLCNKHHFQSISMYIALCLICRIASKLDHRSEVPLQHG